KSNTLPVLHVKITGGNQDTKQCESHITNEAQTLTSRHMHIHTHTHTHTLPRHKAKNTHTHTHTLSHTHTHTLYLSFFLSFSCYFALAFPHCLLSLSLSHTHTHTHYLSVFLSSLVILLVLSLTEWCV